MPRRSAPWRSHSRGTMTSPNSTFVQAKANAPADARPLVDELASGGPHDPSLALELRASRGDVAALGKLEEAARTDVDEGVRSAWGTRDGFAERGGPFRRRSRMSASWTTVLSDNADTAGLQRSGRVARDRRGAAHAPGAKVPRRVCSRAPCAGQLRGRRAVTLEVDGEKLTAEPSSAAASWHVIVRSPEAKVRRTDRGSGHLYAVPVARISDAAHAAECTPHWGHVRGPLALDSGPTLKFDTGESGSAGLEVWMKDGNRARRRLRPQHLVGHRHGAHRGASRERELGLRARCVWTKVGPRGSRRAAVLGFDRGKLPGNRRSCGPTARSCRA